MGCGVWCPRSATCGGVGNRSVRAGAHVVVYTPPLASNVEIVWEADEWARGCRYGGEHHQLLMSDKRGVGLSDRVARPPTLDDAVEDTLAVLDAENLDEVDLVGQSEGGPVAIAIAARHPDASARSC